MIANTSAKQKSFKDTEQNFVSPAAFKMSDKGDDLRMQQKEPKSILKNSSIKKTLKKEYA